MHLPQNMQKAAELVKYFNSSSCECNGYFIRIGLHKLAEYDYLTLKCARGVKQKESQSTKKETTSMMSRSDKSHAFGVTVRCDRQVYKTHILIKLIILSNSLLEICIDFALINIATIAGVTRIIFN